MVKLTGEIHAVEIKDAPGLRTGSIAQVIRGNESAMADLTDAIDTAIEALSEALPPGDGTRVYEVSITNDVIRVSGHHKTEES